MITVIIPIILSLRDIPFITSTTHSFVLYLLENNTANAKIVNLEMFVGTILNSVHKRQRGMS